jgi:hypothetical protein
MKAGGLSPEVRGKELAIEAVAALEVALPEEVPSRGSGKRAVWDVLLNRLDVADVRSALRGVGAGAGGELRATRLGNSAFCSAESSALMAVNFLAPFVSRPGLIGAERGRLTFERELPVIGVRSRVHPHLDAVLVSSSGTYAFEVKVMEPWRDARKVSISPQYDDPAAEISPKTRALLDDLRSGDVSYHWLDAAQLVKHLLGIHSALASARFGAPATLVLLFWQPSDPGRHAPLFNELELEFVDFATRLDDQPVRLTALSTPDLLKEWSSSSSAPWLAEHAACLRKRYDPPLATRDAIRTRSEFAIWAERWLALAAYTGRDVPHPAERTARVAELWIEDVPTGWQRDDDERLLDPTRRYLRSHGKAQHPKPGSEHELEWQILKHDPAQAPTHCFGARLIDGVNAVPLTRDSVSGGRAGNVEADMLLLTEPDRAYRLLLVEAKTRSNNAWYAAIESLRQLRLFLHSPATQRIMRHRNPGMTAKLPVTAVVLAPPTFYIGDGARGRAVQPTLALLTLLRTQFGIDCRLATWNPSERRVDELRL